MNIPSRVEPAVNAKEIKMNDSTRKNRNIDALAWGALFIWWGITLLIQFPAGVGLIGVGLILIAANAARYFQGMVVSGFTTAIGVLALVWGALEMAGTVLSFELPVFPILLIVLGLMVLFGSRREDVIGSKAGA
jgi:hypothetical protein